MTKVILVRHGQTEWNILGKYQGHSDIDLSALGVEQANLLARRLANQRIDAIYASDLRRAIKTAESIANTHQLSVHSRPELREISFGDWEGLDYNTIKSKWPGEVERFFKNAKSVVIPNGETFCEVEQRACTIVQKIIKHHPDQTIVIVSHGGTIRTLLAHALHIPLKYIWNIKQDNTAVNILKYFDNQVIIELLNDTHHLK